MMANQDHLDILTRGVEIWNQWRNARLDTRPDLSSADLSHANLSHANLSYANLSNANLSHADLSHSDLSGAYLSYANLRYANLNRADLNHTDLSYAHMYDANFAEASVGWTIFAEADLYKVKGLAEIKHFGPSPVALYSVQLPQDGSALHFLRGTGVTDEWIDFYRAQMFSPILYHSCFISYSSKDEMLARRLHADLQDHGVRCWFALEDLKIGDHYHQRIDESIHLYDKLILILSEQAIQSNWVEREVVSAREKEDHLGYEVLFPIRLDDAVMQTTKAWAADVRRRWHIGDFTLWEDHDAYQQAFERLLRDLKAEEKP